MSKEKEIIDGENDVTEEVIGIVTPALEEGVLYGEDTLLTPVTEQGDSHNNVTKSDFVATKPNIFLGNFLGDALPQNNLLNSSPLSRSELSFEEFSQLRGVGSLFFAQTSSTSLLGSNALLFDSLIARFNSGTSLSFESNSSAFQRDVIISTAPSVAAPINTGPSNANDVITGTAGNDILSGNILGAPDPISLLQSLTNPTPTTSGSFGSDVAISGNIAVVGASFEDTGASNAGTVYVYDTSTGNLLHTINNPAPDSDDRFGERVAIDGNIIAVSAVDDDTGATNAGTVYIFDALTGNLIDTINNPTPGSNHDFGNSLDIEGNLLIIGETGDNAGATRAGSAYIYDIATGSVRYVFNNPTPEFSERFGNDVSISGSYAVIAASGDNTGGSRAGSVYVYDVSTGNLLHTINNPNPTDDFFGRSVTINGDLIAIANGGAGVDIYSADTGLFINTFTDPNGLTNNFGSDIEISDNYLIVGDALNGVGALRAGSIFIFDILTQDLLHTIRNPNPGSNDFFGAVFDVEDNNIIVGVSSDDGDANNAGATYVYKINFDDADSLFGGAGDDTLFGLNGNDQLYGQGGADSLTGGAGSDRFVFESATAFDGVDVIEDFDLTQGDVIDVSDVLVGYTRGVSDINDFIQFVDSGGDTTLTIDVDGAANGANFQTAAIITGGAGLNEATLENSNQLDGVI